jgi:hypothetical protein
MPNVVDYLDRIGRDAELRYATAEEIERVLAEAQVEPAVRSALLDDGSRLEDLLGVRRNLCCLVHPPNEEPEEEEEEDDTDDEEEEDDSEEVDELRRRLSAAGARTRR